jgi:hypothetical protein
LTCRFFPPERGGGVSAGRESGRQASERFPRCCTVRWCQGGRARSQYQHCLFLGFLRKPKGLAHRTFTSLSLSNRECLFGCGFSATVFSRSENARGAELGRACALIAGLAGAAFLFPGLLRHSSTVPFAVIAIGQPTRSDRKRPTLLFAVLSFPLCFGIKTLRSRAEVDEKTLIKKEKKGVLRRSPLKKNKSYFVIYTLDQVKGP